MSLTERDAVARGATFAYEDGQTRMRAPERVAITIRAEVARRAALFQPSVLRAGTIPVIVIATRPVKRWGECLCCGDPVEHYVSRVCWLCVAARGQARRAVVAAADAATRTGG